MREDLIEVILPIVISVCKPMGHLYVGYANAGGGYIPDRKNRARRVPYHCGRHLCV